jgi:hypothetical protein
MSKYLLPILINLGMLIFGQAAFASAIDFEFLDVSLRPIALGPDERVEGFECEVIGGVVQRISTPFQWDVYVDGSIGGRSRVSASATVGAAEFDTRGLAYFQDFMTIAKFTRPQGRILALKVILWVDVTGGTKKRELSEKDIILRHVSAPEHWF